jgi:hypothetical protein
MEMNADTEMCQHSADSDMDCNGSCMVNKVSDVSQDNNDTARSNNLLLTQYRVNLLSADTEFNKPLLNPIKLEIYFYKAYVSLHSAWSPDPLVPPPKMLPTV